MDKDYMGDGVYVEHDGYWLILTTENGITTTNRIVLEPEVYEALVRYVARIRAMRSVRGTPPGGATERGAK